MDRIFLYFFLFGISVSAHAGSGFYFSADRLSHTMHTETETDVAYSTSTPAPTSKTGTSEKKYSSYGVRLGYKYKRRLTDYFFLAPEFHLAYLDSDSTVYGTNLKFGAEFRRLSIFGVLGVSRIDLLEKNTPNYGVGIEYKITDTWSANAEWQRYSTMKEKTSSVLNVGTQTVTANTDTTRDLNVIKFGFSFYLHE